jgi:hypothetical protein
MFRMAGLLVVYACLIHAAATFACDTDHQIWDERSAVYCTHTRTGSDCYAGRSLTAGTNGWSFTPHLMAKPLRRIVCGLGHCGENALL